MKIADKAQEVVEYLDATDGCADPVNRELGKLCDDDPAQCIACKAYRNAEEVHGWLIMLEELIAKGAE